MEENRQRLLAVDGVNLRVQQQIDAIETFFVNATKSNKDKFAEIYEKATWIDSQLNDSCVVDPFFGFYFYDESDAAAFKLRWT